jgi:hypothetical protein
MRFTAKLLRPGLDSQPLPHTRAHVDEGGVSRCGGGAVESDAQGHDASAALLEQWRQLSLGEDDAVPQTAAVALLLRGVGAAAAAAPQQEKVEQGGQRGEEKCQRQRQPPLFLCFWGGGELLLRPFEQAAFGVDVAKSGGRGLDFAATLMSACCAYSSTGDFAGGGRALIASATAKALRVAPVYHGRAGLARLAREQAALATCSNASDSAGGTGGGGKRKRLGISSSSPQKRKAAMKAPLHRRSARNSTQTTAAATGAVAVAKTPAAIAAGTAASVAFAAASSAAAAAAWGSKCADLLARDLDRLTTRAALRRQQLLDSWHRQRSSPRINSSGGGGGDGDGSDSGVAASDDGFGGMVALAQQRMPGPAAAAAASAASAGLCDLPRLATLRAVAAAGCSATAVAALDIDSETPPARVCRRAELLWAAECGWRFGGSSFLPAGIRDAAADGRFAAAEKEKGRGWEKSHREDAMLLAADDAAVAADELPAATALEQGGCGPSVVHAPKLVRTKSTLSKAEQVMEGAKRQQAEERRKKRARASLSLGGGGPAAALDAGAAAKMPMVATPRQRPVGVFASVSTAPAIAVPGSGGRRSNNKPLHAGARPSGAPAAPPLTTPMMATATMAKTNTVPAPGGTATLVAAAPTVGAGAAGATATAGAAAISDTAKMSSCPPAVAAAAPAALRLAV